MLKASRKIKGVRLSSDREDAIKKRLNDIPLRYGCQYPARRQATRGSGLHLPFTASLLRPRLNELLAVPSMQTALLDDAALNIRQSVYEDKRRPVYLVSQPFDITDFEPRHDAI